MIRTSWRRYRPTKVDTGGESREVIPDEYLTIYVMLEVQDDKEGIRVDAYGEEDVKAGDLLMPEEDVGWYRVTDVKRVPSNHTKTLFLERTVRA
jgi:hypothetical protein